jgi:hypothetical protein
LDNIFDRKPAGVGEWTSMGDKDIDVGRDYDMFALLANVRNYDNVKPFDGADRGLPDDVSPAMEKICEGWGVDGHSHTWYGLKELLEMDWDTKGEALSSGVIPLDTPETIGTMETYVEWVKTPFDERKSPKSYCRSVYAINAKTISEEEAQKILSGETPRNPETIYYVQAQWRQSNADLAGFFYGTIMPKLNAYSGFHPENFRFVMFFDN